MMIEPEVKELVVAFPLDLTIPSAEPETDTVEPAPQKKDDLCHGTVGKNVWYCPECQQHFLAPVDGPHPKSVKHEEEHELVPQTINRADRRAWLQQQRRQPQVQQQLGMCQHCVKPFLGKDRCQCS